MITCLHISNDYSGSTVYKNLIRELDRNELKQILYTPVKATSSIGKNKISLKTKGSEIIYSHILNKTFDRLLYRRKIRKIFRDIESKIDLSKIDVIHAHTWYSDGGVAYLLHKKYNIPYIIAVRSTDINIFYKYLLFERNLGKKIIESALDVILISASYKTRFLNTFASKKIKNKTHIIPNGVDPFWIDNYRKKENDEKYRSKFNILYIGTFIKRKHLPELQEAVIQLNNNSEYDIKLHIIGGGGNVTKEVERKIKEYPALFKYYGKIFDKEPLLAIIRKCDVFAMPSVRETFGLVYIEAMLQGLPILYTENEGIDGYYTSNIGEKVKRDVTVQEIIEKLEWMIKKYEDYKIPLEKIKKNHDWALIAKQYQKLYPILN